MVKCFLQIGQRHAAARGTTAPKNGHLSGMNRRCILRSFSRRGEGRVNLPSRGAEDGIRRDAQNGQHTFRTRACGPFGIGTRRKAQKGHANGRHD